MSTLAPGDHSIELRYDGRWRSYVVHVPTANSPLPRALVLNFHGGGGNARAHQAYVGMDVLADQENFLVAYPNGTGVFGTKLLTWNAGSCCGYARDHSIDDVGFARAVVADLASRTGLDLERVYATGLSNGAMMAYRLGLEAPDLVAAIAPVAGASAIEPDRLKRSMPVMHIHSVNDPRALYGGGLGPPFPMTNQRVLHPPVEKMLMAWSDADGCPQTPQTDAALHGGPQAAHTATKLVHAPCRDQVEVVLWKLTGAGHVWPGGKPDYLTHWLGPSTDVIDANREIWGFLRRFARPH